MAELNARSLKNLDGVHEDLVRVVMLASQKAPFLVTEGLRTKERQLSLVKAGKSRTKNSRHLYGLAVDLCDCDGKYDVPDMQDISKAMKLSALELDIPIEWGGDWLDNKDDDIGWDTPHFQLPKKQYPDTGALKPFVLTPATKKVIGTTIAATVANQTAPAILPTIPLPPTDIVASITEWQKIAQTLIEMASSVSGLIVLCGIVVAFVAPIVARRFA